MEITTTPYKNCDLVKASGRIDSATASQLAEALDNLTGSGHHKIVLELSDVEFMSSAGLRVLISTQKTCKKFGRGELVLALVPERIFNALELAGFVPLFTFYDNVVDAVGNF